MPRTLNQPIALHRSLSLSLAPFLSFSLCFHLSPHVLSFQAAAPASQERIDLWGRFDLPKGLSLDQYTHPRIYPSFPPPTARTRTPRPNTRTPSLSLSFLSEFIRKSFSATAALA